MLALMAVSTLSTIQGHRMPQLFSHGPATPARSPQPGRSAARKPASRAPPTSVFQGSNRCFPAPNSNRLKCVLIHTAPKYIPLSQRTKVSEQQPQTKQPEERQDTQRESYKVILQRFLLEDGSITFALGTKNGDLVTRDANEVPLRDIFHHVTSAELERFENRDFVEADEREEKERLLKIPRKKAPRRPRKYPIPGLISGGPASGLDNKRPRDRPRENVVSAPSFDRPRPTLEVLLPIGLGSSTPAPASASSSAIESTPRRRQYSMIAASGLAPPATSEEETSREVSMSVTPDREAPSKRRKIGSSDTVHYRASISTPVVRIPLSTRPKASMVTPQPAQKSVAYGLTRPTEDLDSEAVDTIKPSSRTYDGPQDQSPSLGADEERKLLHRQSQTRPMRHSSPASSSSSEDSLTGSNTVQRRSQHQALRAEQMQADALDRSFPAIGRPAASIASPPLDSRVGDITIQASPQTPSNKSRPRKVSLTPHFPDGIIYDHHSSYNSTDTRPVSSTSTHNNNSSKPSQTHTYPNKRKLSPEPIAHTHSNPRPSRIPTSNPLKPLIPTNDITKFFRPRFNPVTASRCIASEDDESGDDYSDEEKDDLIVHNSSLDVPRTQVRVVPRHARGNTLTPVEVDDSQGGPNTQLTTNQLEEANRDGDSSDDDESIELELASDNIVPTQSIGSTRIPLADLDKHNTTHRLRVRRRRER
ncbi:hypothetical protein N7G274_010188 [Stereocaulon virgatum]|uniref:Uncharacterized protein n=1 Tax=Stereocaulon virgatum TaxID=373712 RepID=A0ABR3ZVX4_9LECA